MSHARLSTRRGVEGRKSARQIGLEILDVFEPDMQPQRRAARRPVGRGTVESQSKGIARLSKPPHEYPMPNSLTASSKASTAFCDAGFSTTLNRPDAPVKSRFQIA